MMAVAGMTWRSRFRRSASDQAADDALSSIVATALPRIYGYILVRVGQDVTVAEDLTQETMLALTRTRQTRPESIGDPTAWLFGTARHKVIDWYRTRGLLITELQSADSVIDPVDDIDRVLVRDELVAALDRLAPAQRLVLVLHYADGLSTAEIGREVDRSVHAVESLLARGRVAMRRNVAEQDGAQ